MDSDFQENATVLRSALAVEPRYKRPDTPPRPVPPPPPAESVHRLLEHDRLKAAVRADVALYQATEEAGHRPGNAGVIERFISVLGAWAVTRAALGLRTEAGRAVDQALAWAEIDPCSSLYAFTVQRAVSVLEPVDSVARLEHALAVHMSTGSAPAVARALVQLADVAAGAGDSRRALATLEAALGLAPSLGFAVRERVVRIHLAEGRVDEAERILDSLDDSEAPLPVLRLHRAADAAVAEARERFGTALRLQLEAVGLSATSSGAEILLEDLLTAARIRERIDGELDAEDVSRLLEAVRTLRRADKEDDEWRTAVRRLSRRLISGEPVDGTEPETLRERLLQLQRSRLSRKP